MDIVDNANDVKFTDSDKDKSSVTWTAVKDEPRISLEKWGSEWLSIGYPMTSVFSKLSSKITYGGVDASMQIYPVTDGLEVELVFAFAPPTNVFVFDMTAHVDAQFVRQPPLDEEWRKGQIFLGQTISSVNPMEVRSDKGVLLMARPSNVINSYAVYSGRQHGQYGTGKVGHIYRPKAIDATNDSVWCDMVYDAGALTITIPQQWLEKAVYPVILDPTLGYSTIGASNTSISNAFINGWGPHTPSENGTVTAANLYVSGVSGSENLTMGQYDSTPSARQGVTAGGTIAAGTGWRSQAMTSTLTNGTAVRIAAAVSTTVAVKYDSQSAGWKYADNTYSAGTLPDPFGTINNLDLLVSAYFDYTASGGGATTKKLSALGVG